jgi:hypothetical protein
MTTDHPGSADAPLPVMMKRDECVVKSFVYGLRFGDREGPVQPRVWSGRPPGGDPSRCALWGRCGSDHLGPACCLSQARAVSRAGSSSRSGIRAMLSAENMRRPSSCQCSCCSSSTAPTKRMIAGSFRKMPTTLLRRLMERVAKRTSRCDVNPLQQVGASDLEPVVLGEVTERQHVFFGFMHEGSSLGEALRQRDGQIITSGLDLRSGFLGEHAAQGSRDHALVRLLLRRSLAATGTHCSRLRAKWIRRVLPSAPLGATLPHTALQLAADRLGETGVRVSDHQLDAIQAPLFEVGDELCPEGLGLSVAHLETQELATAIAIKSLQENQPTGQFSTAMS